MKTKNSRSSSFKKCPKEDFSFSVPFTLLGFWALNKLYFLVSSVVYFKKKITRKTIYFDC